MGRWGAEEGNLGVKAYIPYHTTHSFSHTLSLSLVQPLPHTLSRSPSRVQLTHTHSSFTRQKVGERECVVAPGVDTHLGQQEECVRCYKE